ncbi:dihydrodipicolinate synthase family protein [Chelatococcus reniformis]|uniref:4-hydroxy-tetrahydrodipicolinate synthase n=1 Tax=Chelatococcus reniformis TaxID=1494448 RepID=A0A916UFV8_9HYPH|nr:dihydrodipicolinate synthase family protein [Chelatococcus reniformis]GGC72018.1 4-hydroxy-tetrahydrodipicolinate synthase [Chelatococcus reniformis]
MTLSGSIAALATPFGVDGVDERAFADLADWQIGHGTNGLAVATAEGEYATLEPHEYVRLVAVAAECAAGRVPVLVGIASPATDRAIAQGQLARTAGADALVVTTPPYIRPSQRGLLRHFEAVAAAVDLPLIVHNDPDRTRVDLAPQTAEHLRAVSGITGYIEGAPGLPRALSALRLRGDGLCVLTTDEVAAVPFLLAGGSGLFSVVANVTPQLCASLFSACLLGDGATAVDLQQRLSLLSQAIDGDADPAAMKYALFLIRGRFSPKPRLPLVEPSCVTERRIAAALERLRADVEYT